MTLSHIVAVAKNGVIGKNGDLPWHLPEDLRFFKEKTKGHIIIMGRKTYESMGRPLPHRLNIVVTQQKDYQAPGCTVVHSLKEAMDKAEAELNQWPKEVFIIGGHRLFAESLARTDTIYLTRIYQDFEGDTSYIDVNWDEFELSEQIDRHDPLEFSFLTYHRK